MNYFKLLARFILFVIHRFSLLRCTEIAASLSYTSLLSLVPLLAVVFAGFSSFSVFHDLLEGIQQFIFANFVPSSSDLIQTYLNEFVDKASRLTLTGLLGLFFVALMLMWQIDKALNRIWGSCKAKSRMRTLLSYWAVLSLGPIFMGVSLMVTSYIISLPFINNAANTIGLQSQLLPLIPIMLTFFAFTMIYLIIPNTKVSFVHALVGGITATIFFEIAKRGFALYVSHNTTYSSLYGTLAIIPIFLIWIYISWLVTLLGAVTTRSMSLFDFSLESSSYSVNEFLSSFHVLRVLSQAAQSGQALSDEQIHMNSCLHSEKNLDEVLFQLQQNAWIIKTENDLWTLARDLDKVTFWELYQDLPYQWPKETNDVILSKVIKQGNHVLSEQLEQSIKQSFEKYD